MAPRPPATPGKRPSARAKALARLNDPLLPRKLHRADNVVSDSFSDTKRDRRTIKRSVFLSRVGKSAAAKKTPAALKRRRPAKKLVATLESLGDALDEIAHQSGGEDGTAAPQPGKVRHRSIASRPGALKRKEKVVKGEMERFSRSLAQLAALPATGEGEREAERGNGEVNMQGDSAGEEAAAPAPVASSNRWAALRGFITATMEQNPAFVGKG